MRMLLWISMLVTCRLIKEPDMDSYMSLQEKRAFIDKDFKDNFIDKVGKLPADVDSALA